jgi:hypothetical protein
MWDLIVAGGGTSGVAAAISAARHGCKVLIVEKNTFLGGDAAGALVTPMMNNYTDNHYNAHLYNEILDRLKKTGDSAVFKDGNHGWFNPEMLKCVLDDFCEENGIDIIFDSTVVSAEVADGCIKSINCLGKSGITNYKAKFFIDATGDADLAFHAGIGYEFGENGTNQAMTLRFIMANIDLDIFAKWLMNIDPDTGVSVVDYKDNGEILLSTACTWDDNGWKLKPYFDKGIDEGIIKPEDSAYFQVFSIPGQRNALAFNCPRIYSAKNLNPLDMNDISYALRTGRKQLRRIAEFCRKTFHGFEHAYISQIAPKLGIRDSRRIEGVYRLTEQDIISGKKFDNAAAKSNYPIDIHSTEKNKSELTYFKQGDYYEIPLESLIPKGIDNLLVAGKIISAAFKAQASVRIQPTCWDMGESAGKYAAKIFKRNFKNE